MKTLARLIAAAYLAILLSACGESRREVLDRHRASYEAMAGELASLAETLPATPVAPAGPLDPVPVFNDKLDKESSNLGILMFEQLAAPAADMDADAVLDLRLANGITDVFSWINEKGGSQPDIKVVSSFEAELKRVLTLRYLGVVKLDIYRPPTVTSEAEFNPGIATGTIHLVDRETGKVVFSGPFSAKNDDRVGAQLQEGEDIQTSISKWLHSNLWSRTREAVAQSLKEGTGARVDL